MKTLVYPYKQQPKRSLGMLLMLAPCSLFLAYLASTNTQGLVLLRVIELSPENAATFFSVVAALSALFVFLGILMFISSLTSKQTLEITKTGVSFPMHFLSRRRHVVAFADIHNLTIHNFSRDRMFNIHFGSKTASILRSMLPSPQIFEDTCELIYQRSLGLHDRKQLTPSAMPSPMPQPTPKNASGSCWSKSSLQRMNV